MGIKNVMIDCDPSADDAIALILALHSPELNVAGITAVSGVCHVKQSTLNVLKILELCGRCEVPVAQGADQPFCHKMVFDSLYGGNDGLSETDLPEPSIIPCQQPAAEFIISQVEKYAGNIHIISTAPMTNLALAMTLAPEIKHKICSIITSSGSYGVTLDLKHKNPRPAWNIANDPEAAKIVMESGVLIEAIGLDITSQFSNHMTDILLSDQKEFKQTPAKEFFQKAVRYNLLNGLDPCSLLVDSVAVAYAVQPEIAKMQEGKVAVETQGNLTRGQTLFGNEGYLDWMESKIKAAYEFDIPLFLKLLSERVLK